MSTTQGRASAHARACVLTFAMPEYQSAHSTSEVGPCAYFAGLHKFEGQFEG